MSFNPATDVIVTRGPMSVNTDELCTAASSLHALISTLDHVLTDIDTAFEVNSRLISSHYGASAAFSLYLSAARTYFMHLRRRAESLLAALTWAALKYAEADKVAALWELSPYSPLSHSHAGQGPVGAYMALNNFLLPWEGLWSSYHHRLQGLLEDKGWGNLAGVIDPAGSAITMQHDALNTVADILNMFLKGDNYAGVRLEHDISLLMRDFGFHRHYRDWQQGPQGNTYSTAEAASVLAPLLTNLRHYLHGHDYGVVVIGTDGHPHIRWNSSVNGAKNLGERAKAAVGILPPAPPDDEYDGAPSSADVIERINALHVGDESNGEIAIEEHITTDEMGVQHRSWSVDIKGTKDFTCRNTGPQDSLTNIKAVAGLPNDQLDAVKEAMGAAGIAPGEAVELVGHSQGGIIATQLAADEGLHTTYNIVGVVTAGSPIATLNPHDVPVISYENMGDIVPGLDGASTQSERVTTVTFNNAHADPDESGEVPFPHSAHLYAQEIRESLEAATTPTNANLRTLREAEETRLKALGLNDTTHTTVHHYVTRRITEQ